MCYSCYTCYPCCTRPIIVLKMFGNSINYKCTTKYQMKLSSQRVWLHKFIVTLLYLFHNMAIDEEVNTLANLGGEK